MSKSICFTKGVSNSKSVYEIKIMFHIVPVTKYLPILYFVIRKLSFPIWCIFNKIEITLQMINIFVLSVLKDALIVQNMAFLSITEAFDLRP